MKTIVALLLLFVSLPLAAQYGPPAKDLEDAQFYMRELQRQLGPAMTEARDQAAVFRLIAQVHVRLIGKQPDLETEGALKRIDEFLERREREDKPLSPENLKTVMSVRKEIELAAQPPYAVTALRERLHHEFVHPLEVKALKNLQLLQQLESQWEMLTERGMKPIREDTMSAIGITASESRQ